MKTMQNEEGEGRLFAFLRWLSSFDFLGTADLYESLAKIHSSDTQHDGPSSHGFYVLYAIYEKVSQL